MKKIKLHNSVESVVVDEEDYDRLSLFQWYRNARSGNVSRVFRERGKVVNVSLACEVMQERHLMFDHVNRDSLDNRKVNLRSCSYLQNNRNVTKRKNATSKYKGVSFEKRRNLWYAQIMVNYKTISLGYWEKEAEAALAYNNGALKYFGEFAYLNQIVEENTN
jgi:hypothetical protein